MARMCVGEGADAISLINTLLGTAIDVETRTFKLANITGGLSGPAIKPVALRMIWQVAHAVSVPVIGIGGITTGEDAVEFLLAGATAIQVGTANFVNPTAAIDVAAGIEDYLMRHNIAHVSDIVGTVRRRQ
jgi:dihydroorotate dehydrogenase (NAD+) catalytic subunit